MATRKKKNPYEEFGLQSAGLSSGDDTDWKTDNPYEEYGQRGSKKERDPKLVWDWNKPSKEDVAQAVVDAKKKEEEKQKPEERKRSIWEKIGDKFEANSPEDIAKRVAEGKKERYQDEPTKGYSSIGNRIGDIFEANSPQDKAKRIAAGEEETYQHQQALEKEAKVRNQKLNYTKEEVDARRDYFNRQGVDIDKALDLRSRYADIFKEDKEVKGKGIDWKKLAEQAKEEGLFEGNDKAQKDLDAAYQFEKQGSENASRIFFRQSVGKALENYDTKKLEGIERDFSDFKASQGKEALPQQINRNFQRGLAESIVKFPGSVRTLAAGAVDLVAPEGSRVDKFGQQQYEAGKQNLKDVDQQLIDQGVGANPEDNQFVANVSSGAGSLASSLFLGGIGNAGKTSTATGWLAKAKSALNPGLPGAVFGTNAGAEQYIGALDAGKSDFQAFGTAIVGGAAEGYLEKLGVDKFLKADGGTMKKFITRSLSEGIQEASQSFSQSGVKSTYTSVDFSDALMQALEEGGYGALIGGGASISMSLAENMVAKGVPEDVAKETADKVAQKLETIAQEELPEPDGDAVVGLLNDDGTPVDGDIPTDGDSIVKALQDEGGVPVDGQPTDVLPTDGDEVIKQLQGDGTEVLPTDGDSIVKELQGGDFAEGQTVTFDGKERTIGSILEQEGDTKYELKSEDGKVIWTNKAGLEKQNTQKPDSATTEQYSREPVTINNVTDTVGNFITKNISKADKKGIDSSLIGREYNEGLNTKVLAVEDLRTNKSEEGLTIIGDMFVAKKGDEPQLILYTIDHTKNTLTRKAAKEAEIQAKLNALDNKPETLPVTPKKKGAVKPLKKSSKADYELRYPEAKELPNNLKDKLPLDQKELQKSGKQKPKETNQLSPTEVSKIQGLDTLFTKQSLKELLRLIPDLKSNPQLKVIKGEYTTGIPGSRYYGTDKVRGLMLQYESKDGKQEFKIPLTSIGITESRLEDAGLKDGDTVDLSSVLTAKGRLPTLRNTRTGVDYHEGINHRSVSNMGTDVARTPEELIDKIEQLNRAGQLSGIMRKGQLRSKKAAGLHQAVTRAEWVQGKLGTVKLRDDVILTPEAYMTVLAHELSHAMEFAINGTTGKTLSLFGELTKEEKTKITDELKAIVNNIEGKELAESKPGYFYKPTEMLARYVETLLMTPGGATDAKGKVTNTLAQSLAPTVSEKFEQAVLRHSSLQDLIEAINGTLKDKSGIHAPSWWLDLRQLYQKHLGKRVGDMAYGAEVVRRARIQAYHKGLDKLLKEKFKGVKDDPAELFRAAEAIKQTDDQGNIVYGTRDIQKSNEMDEIKDLMANGWVFVKYGEDRNGDKVAVFAKQRYTPEQGKRMFEALSPEGQKLITDFVAQKEKAKDVFNRDYMKELFKIDGEIEGWVHRGLREKESIRNRMALSSQKVRGSLREKKAGVRKQRQAEAGQLEDFRKQMEKALRELGDQQINNEFIEKQIARISKPIAKNGQPDKGWVEIVYDPKTGVRLPGEVGRERVSVERTDELSGEPLKFSFLKPQTRLQVPAKLAEHYRNIRDVPVDMTRTQKILTALGKYWAINVLLHGGTVSTNFIGGGIQYSAKVMEDFYTELITGNVTMPQTRRNIAAMVQVLLPHGWTNAQDFVYGGMRSNYAGQFQSPNKAEDMIDKIGNVGLAPMGAVESYWKKTIMIAEGAHKMKKQQLKKEMIDFSKEEEQMIADVNKIIDNVAYDYDNVPLGLDNFGRKGGLVKPFVKYPYKYMKQVTSLATGAFDRDLPPATRAAKLLTLATLVAASAALMGWRDEEKETPDGTEKTPGPLNPRGRLFLWKGGDGTELFMRTAKYPFINLTSTGKAMIEGDWEEARNILTDQFGTLGIGLDTALVLTGRSSQYEQYTPMSAQLGKRAATFIPGFRVLNDIGRLLDDNARSPENFVQGVFSNLPVWGSEETKQNLRGDARTIKIPVEPEQRSIAGSSTEEREIKLNNADTILSALTGIYITRINPEEAKQQQLREQRNSAENRVRALLKDGKEGEAAEEAKKVGLTIPDGTYDYYRRQRSK